jgi:hypothetical protein
MRRIETLAIKIKGRTVYVTVERKRKARLAERLVQKHKLKLA